MNHISEQFYLNIYFSLTFFVIILSTIIVFNKKNQISKKIIDFISFYFIVLIAFNTSMSLFFQSIFYVKICILLSISFLIVKMIGFFFKNYFFYFNFKAMKIKNLINNVVINNEIRKVECFFNKKENKIVCNIYLYTTYNQEKDYEIIKLIKVKNKLADDINIFYF